MGVFSPYILLFLLSTAGSHITNRDQYSDGDDGDNGDGDYKTDVTNPVFTASPQNFTVGLGGSVTFPCDVENLGNYLVMFKHVMKDGEHRTLFVGDLPLRQNKKVTKTENKFTVHDIKKYNSGSYVCRIETTPPIEVTHSLNVHYPPTVERVSARVQRVVQGSSVTLECESEGNPRPTITWTRSEGRLFPSGVKKIQGPRVTVVGTDEGSEGTYVCTAYNGILDTSHHRNNNNNNNNNTSSSSSADFTVHLQYPPLAHVEQEVTHTGVGARSVDVSCEVSGRPVPSVSWVRSGHTLSPADPRYILSHHDDHHHHHHRHHRHHTLTIKEVKEEDFGEYFCVAESSLGRSNASLRLTGLPGVPRVTSSAAGGEGTRYILTWEAATHSPLIMYRLQHRKTRNGGGGSGHFNNPSGGHWNIGLFSPTNAHTNNRTGQETPNPGPHIHMSHAISDLEPATDYEAKVAVENKFGWSADSDVFHFYTRKEITTTTTTTTTKTHSSYNQNFLPINKEVAIGQSLSGGAGEMRPPLLLPLLPLLLFQVCLL